MGCFTAAVVGITSEGGVVVSLEEHNLRAVRVESAMASSRRSRRE